MTTYLVAGGAGFFGEVLVRKLLERGEKVVCFDLNRPHFEHANLTVLQGDIREVAAVEQALEGVDVVHHNVAQVPVAKDRDLFWSVNRDGTRNLLEKAAEKGVRRFVYTSSSAVFGVPEQNPVTAATSPAPREAYGEAKLAGEHLCHDYAERGLSCSIIRPRTVLGTGRLGIFQILFEWIYQGRNVPVLGKGDNIYQFVHSDDLADACIAAGEAEEAGTFNIGTDRFGSMRDVLEKLVQHAGSKSRVKSVPAGLAEFGMKVTSAIGLSPLGPYHSLMYGRSMYFDIADAQAKLGYKPVYSNDEMFAATYDWYCANRDQILSGSLSGSKHQSAMKQRILTLVPYFL
ncbi:MAG: NAD-dependent epimerase/dehydratase family protein [Alphaproteobacteria bacterium]|nr:MAG: NAD-dependent epimerase/dehydratase family protein [Alphaproteobacteria bacterium]